MSFKIYPVLKRNLQIFVNSRLSSLILIFGPIFLILILGIALHNPSLANIKASIYAPEGTSDSVVNGLSDSLRELSWSVVRETSLEQCAQKVMTGSHVCIELQKQRSSSIFYNEPQANYQLVLHVDLSRQRTVWAIINTVSGIIDKNSEEIRKSALENVHSEINQIIRKIDNRREQLDESITLLNEIYSSVDDLADDFKDIKSKLNSVNVGLGLANEEISYLSAIGERLPDSSYWADPSDRAEILSAINSLREKNRYAQEQVQSLISFIDSNSEQFSSDALKDKLDEVRNELLVGKRELSDLKKDIERVRDTDLNRVLTPIPVSYQSVSGGEGSVQSELEFFDYLFPSFLMFFIIFMGMLLATAITIRERSSLSHIRNMVSGNSLVSFSIGNLAIVFIVLAVQIGFIVLIASPFVHLPLLSNLSSLAIISFISCFVAAEIGMVFGFIFGSGESAIIASISVALLFLIFLPVITPTETLPSVVGTFVSHTPFVILEAKLRETLIFDSSLHFLLGEFIALLITILSATIILLVFAFRSREDEI